MIEHREGHPTDLETLRLLHGENEVPGLYASVWRTFTIEGRVVATWGLLMRWPHVAELCGCVSDELRGRHALTFVRQSRRLLETAAWGNQLRRVTGFVDSGFPEHRRFASGAGFVIEGVMHEAAPAGRDLIIYVRKFPWGASSAVSSAEESRALRQPQLHRLPTMPVSGRTTASGPERPAGATRKTSLG